MPCNLDYPLEQLDFWFGDGSQTHTKIAESFINKSIFYNWPTTVFRVNNKDTSEVLDLSIATPVTSGLHRSLLPLRGQWRMFSDKAHWRIRRSLRRLRSKVGLKLPFVKVLRFETMSLQSSLLNFLKWSKHDSWRWTITNDAMQLSELVPKKMRYNTYSHMMIHPAEWSYGSVLMEFFNLSHTTLENICTHLKSYAF